MDINNLLLDLEIIKQIKENDKLCVTTLPGEVKLHVHNPSMFSGVSRWYNGYNREDTIKYLVDLTENIEKSCEMLINGNHSELAETLNNTIKSSIEGISNLKKTYINDSIVVAKLILINNRLNKIINSLTDFLDDSIDDINNMNEITMT